MQANRPSYYGLIRALRMCDTAHEVKFFHLAGAHGEKCLYDSAQTRALAIIKMMNIPKDTLCDREGGDMAPTLQVFMHFSADSRCP